MSGEIQSIRTLIVDEDQLVIEQITDVLSNFKEFEWIETCASGLEAIDRIQERRPDLVILETELKDMNGFELMQRIFPVSAPQFVFVTRNEHHAVKAFDEVGQTPVLAVHQSMDWDLNAHDLGQTHGQGFILWQIGIGCVLGL